jgi:hypothetical protein
MLKSFAGLSFDNSYAKLPNYFYESLDPIKVKDPFLIILKN